MTTEASAVSEADTEGKQKTSGAEPEPESKQKPEAAASDPEGEQSSKKAQEQASEPGPADVATSPEEEQLKPRTRTSAGKGLSRLFSNFLKRRSQCSEGEGFEAEKAREEKADKEEKVKGSSEEQVKAPIAAPEPELKTEPEAEQAPDQHSDQHSVSSAEIQQEEEAAKGEEKATEQAKKEKPVKEKKTEKKTEEAKGSKRQKTMQCKVTLLDDTQFECELDKHAKGQELLTKVCDHVNLVEKDYFGLANWETPTNKTWLEPTKEIRKQVSGAVYEFTFNVKFYPPDPAQLTEDLTRYFLCLQLRKDIMRGVLPCSFVTLSLLGSYTAQSELGEYDPELHGSDYVKDLSLAPGQNKELEEKVMELHRTYRSMSPAQADMLFLENAKKLAMYGVDLHQAKDLDGVDITLGVCSSGLMVYKDKLRINRFPWPKVLKISYKRSSFFIKIRPSEQEQYESTIGFKLPNYKASKKLWKVCVEHHTFFRVSTVEPPSSRRFLVLGSKFRYSGRTQAQTRQASSMIDRPAPRFTRSASKRLSRNLDGVVSTQRGTRPVSAPVFSHAALMEAGIPMATLDQPQTSTPIKTSMEERKLEVTVEAVEPSKIEAEVKEFDKPQEDLLRHHASISELKRNFMEAVPETRPSEWDKRLSTHSPFRTLGINGQPLPSADGVISTA
uniref:Protein 4.1 n=1 Tax=Amphiprion ocellaris TaxID=80972 RepID=A0AAQ5XH92_AMPOC